MNSRVSEYFEKGHLTGFVFLMIILVCTTIFRIPTLFEPWGGDQGVYGYIANGILEGRVPYKDMYTNTGYGLYFTYALFFKLFGNHMMALHIGDLIASLAIIILVFYLTKVLYGRECAVYAGILAAFFGNGQAFSCLVDMQGAWGTYWHLAQRETFMTIFFTASILISIISDRKKRWIPYIWVGILIGLAAAFKATAVGIAFFLILYLFYAEVLRKDGDGLTLFIRKCVYLGVGFVIIQLPFLYYFWIHDSLLTMYNAVFVHTSLYAKLSRGNIVANAFMGNTYILFETLFLCLFSFAAMIYLLFHERLRENVLVAVWAIGTLLIVWAQGKFFGYHFILIIAPFSVLTGFGIKHFLKVMPTWRKSFLSAGKDMTQIFLWGLLACNLAFYMWDNYEYYRWSAKYLTGQISKDQYYDVFNEYPLHMYSFRADYDVANYLKTHASQDTTVRNIYGGGDTIIHYLSGVESPTRFTSTWYLFNFSLYDDPLTTALRNEFIEGIKEEKPEYILLIYYNMDEFREKYKDEKYKDTIMLMDYINDHYALEKSFRDRRSLYKRL